LSSKLLYSVRDSAFLFRNVSGEVSRGEKMLESGTDPESYITECTLVYEDFVKWLKIQPTI